MRKNAPYVVGINRSWQTRVCTGDERVWILFSCETFGLLSVVLIRSFRIVDHHGERLQWRQNKPSTHIWNRNSKVAEALANFVARHSVICPHTQTMTQLDARISQIHAPGAVGFIKAAMQQLHHSHQGE